MSLPNRRIPDKAFERCSRPAHNEHLVEGEVLAEADYFTAGEDKGCPRLRQLLGQPITCLTCPLDRCLEEMTREEIESVKERLRLTEHISVGGYK